MAKGRRHNPKGRSEGQERFVQFPYWVLETRAALDLSGTAFKVLVYVLKRFNGANNGTIGFGARSGCFVRATGTGLLEDRPIGLKPRTISDTLNELVASGFIACTKESTFDQKRRTREWRLTWLAVGSTAATKEFTTLAPVTKRSKKQKPERQAALCTEIQSGSALYGPPTEAQNILYRAAARSMAESDRAAARPHLGTIPGGDDTLSMARALSVRRANAVSAAQSSVRQFSSKLTNRRP
jgi:hypothetical protein